MTNRRTSEDKLGHAKREIKALSAKLAQKDELIKALSAKLAQKDELIKEIEKMRDYCQRWIDVEKSR